MARFTHPRLEDVPLDMALHALADPNRLAMVARLAATERLSCTDAAAAVHRGWINIKSAFTGGSDSSVLEAAETGEASALKAYETALSAQDIPAGAKTVFQQQHDAVLQAKNWLSQNKNS